METDSFKKLLIFNLIFAIAIQILMLVGFFILQGFAMMGGYGSSPISTMLAWLAFFGVVIFDGILISAYAHVWSVYRICPVCKIKTSANFCPKCGKPLTADVPQTENKNKICSKCGQALKGETFCPGCGTKTN
jgi:RNA polymerase subunit RPABC4/transcription elongation factor Spt4